MIGAKLTAEQFDLIQGKYWTKDSLFNPLQDVEGVWFISSEEVSGCDGEGLEWVNTLELSEVIMPVSKLE